MGAIFRISLALMLALVCSACALFESSAAPTRRAEPAGPVFSITPATAAPGATEVAVYLPRLFEDGSLGLQAVPRHVVLSGDPLRDLLLMFIQGPDGNERADNYQYAIDRRTQVVTARLEGDTVHLELDEGLLRVHGRPYSELVYWSLVFTLTELPGVHGVSLREGDRPLATLGDPPFAVPVRGSRAMAPPWARPR